MGRWIEGQVATMLKSRKRQIDTLDKSQIKSKKLKKVRGDKTEVPPWDGQQ